MTKALTRFLLAIPIVYLFLFLSRQVFGMLVISFAYPGEYGGIEPFWQHGHLHLTGESYLRFSLYRSILDFSGVPPIML